MASWPPGVSSSPPLTPPERPVCPLAWPGQWSSPCLPLGLQQPPRRPLLPWLHGLSPVQQQVTFQNLMSLQGILTSLGAKAILPRAGRPTPPHVSPLNRSPGPETPWMRGHLPPSAHPRHPQTRAHKASPQGAPPHGYAGEVSSSQTVVQASMQSQRPVRSQGSPNATAQEGA